MTDPVAAEAPLWATAVTLAPSLAALCAALIAGRAASAARSWRAAQAGTAAMVLAALAVAVLRIAGGERANGLVRVDDITVAVVGLIALIGAVVVRYSATYLAGDPHERRYAARIMLTLAAVGVVVVANNLLVIMVAWAAVSLALHGLLTFFGDRPVALAVAHKKFLLARAADACMVGGVVAFAAAFGTLRIDRIGEEAVAAGSLPGAARLGIVLIAMAALLKSAQLPFHGWLIQVMEAPTPVSALLHAGVVNLGGLVLLRLAPVMDLAVEARVLVVAVGVATAVVASLVMTTRVSIKVALAWSTCAQMGFMLVQCGLGLWEMALLHLLAHSVYKAHAFLSAGTTVRQTQRRRLVAEPAAPTLRSVAFGTVAALAGTAVVAVVWEQLPAVGDLSPTVWLMLGIVALALVPLTTPGGQGGANRLLGRWLAVPVAYLALHELMSRIVPKGSAAPTALLVATGLAFVALFALQTMSAVAPESRFALRVRPWVYAGMFLDDVFTRIAFRVSPPPAPTARPAPLPRPASVTVTATSATSAPAVSAMGVTL